MPVGLDPAKKDALMASFHITLCLDCIKRAGDEMRSRDDVSVNWDYVEKQLALAQSKLAAAGVIAATRAAMNAK
jgi:hypothetical protein